MKITSDLKTIHQSQVTVMSLGINIIICLTITLQNKDSITQEHLVTHAWNYDMIKISRNNTSYLSPQWLKIVIEITWIIHVICRLYIGHPLNYRQESII